MNWEYKTVTVGAGNVDDELPVRLAALGSLGWEAFGITCVVQMGPNAVSVLLKRECPAMPPLDGEARWAPDPSERFEQRYWDGFRWTEHVTRDGTTATNYPTV